MARLARVIAPGMPHPVTQRGNRGQQTFFGDEDYQHHLELISRFCRAEQVAIWAYCLMPNHVHLIVVPQSAESLRRAIHPIRPKGPARALTRFPTKLCSWVTFTGGSWSHGMKPFRGTGAADRPGTGPALSHRGPCRRERPISDL